MGACGAVAATDNGGVFGGTLTILDPTATPRESVSLSFTDTVTAVTCSMWQRERGEYGYHGRERSHSAIAAYLRHSRRSEVG